MRNMKKLLLLCGLAVGLLAIWCQPVMAKPKPKKEEPAPTETSTVSTTIPWIIGGVLAAGALLVAFKNSKRTHLD